MIFKKNYQIPINDNEVNPEDTLLDASSEHSDLEEPIAPFTFRFMFYIFTFFVLVVFAFTFKISILDHSYFYKLSIQNRSSTFAISPPRGLIYDQNGEVLAKNIISFDLLVVSKEFTADSPNVSISTVIPKLANIIKQSPQDLEKLINNRIKTDSVFFISKNLNKDQVLRFSYLEPKGVYLIPNNKRYYADGQQFSDVIGYVSKVSDSDLEDSYYLSNDYIGRIGVESQYENVLRGEHGRIFFGDSQSSDNINPETGQSLVLNIDRGLQKELFNEVYAVLKDTGLSRAAAIVQNPQTGAVLGMVSFPSFDNNIIVSGLDDASYKSLFENKSKPLFNRVISGLYNPGSTIKPFIALMILQEGIFKPSDTIKDCVSLTVPNPSDREHPYIFKNWRQDFGLFNLRRAIANSCNIYFFTAGGGFGNIAGLGIERIANYLHLAFADLNLGIDLPSETHGFIPTPDWKLINRGQSWYQGDTYNISIGQGDLIVTPLWLNSYISSIANGGTVYKPQVVQKIVDDNKNNVQLFKPEILGKLPFKNDVIKEVRSDMQETIISGTAQLLKDLPVSAGAKTGTAEVIKGRSINSLFTAFAPFNNPEISITVLVEGSVSNQGLAIRAANNVLKWYFTNKQVVTSP